MTVLFLSICKSIGFNARYGVGYIDARQTATLHKSPLPNAHYRVRYIDARQTVTVPKCPVSNKSDFAKVSVTIHVSDLCVGVLPFDKGKTVCSQLVVIGRYFILHLVRRSGLFYMGGLGFVVRTPLATADK